MQPRQALVKLQRQVKPRQALVQRGLVKPQQQALGLPVRAPQMRL
jgi:hypothetical protein